MRGVRNSIWTSAILAAFAFDGSPINAQSLVPRGSEQPSFDCSKATSGAARLICADGELADEDGRLADLYKDRYARLDKTGQFAFRTEQVSWIRQRNQSCGLTNKDRASIQELAPAKACMLKWMGERIAILEALPASPTTSQAPKTAAAGGADIAALKPGTYVQISTPCRDAPFAVREMFDGKMFIAGKSCPFALKGRHGQQLEITNKCEGEGGEGLDSGTTAIFSAKSQTEYSVKTDVGVFNFRYCSQAELEGTANQAATIQKGAPLGQSGKKKDILGFVVGAPLQSVLSSVGQGSARGCSTGEWNPPFQIIYCQEGRVQLSVATALQPPLVTKVSLRFCDAHDFSQIGQSVSNQFGTNLQTTTMLMGTSASGRLDASTVITIETQPYSSCSEGAPYILSLYDGSIDQANNTAAERARRSAPMRKF